MAENKNQHFVPKFYLRNFAPDERQRSINLFNIARARSIQNASISSQCCRDYWHGVDGLEFEKTLASIESDAAATVRKCIAEERLVDVRFLKFFTLVQASRTVYEGEAHEEFCEKIRNLAVELIPDGWKYDPRQGILNVLRISPIIFDLGACLLINRTRLDFITSDNPVAVSNWWQGQSQRNRDHCGCGWAAAGLEICLPLSPRRALMFYDQNIWSIPKLSRSMTAIIRHEADVMALNERQLLNAHQNVYFSCWNMRDEVDVQYRACKDIRRGDKFEFNEFPESTETPLTFGKSSTHEHGDEPSRSLLITRKVEIRPKSRITILSKRTIPRFHDTGTGLGVVRDLAWMKIVEQFRDEMLLGRLKFPDFEEFAVRHPLYALVGAWKKGIWQNGEGTERYEKAS